MTKPEDDTLKPPNRDDEQEQPPWESRRFWAAIQMAIVMLSPVWGSVFDSPEKVGNMIEVLVMISAALQYGVGHRKRSKPIRWRLKR